MGTDPATRNPEFADSLLKVGKDPSHLVFEDELTGIHNRRFLLSYFDQKVDWSRLSDFPISLLSADLDEFKLINDQHGHEVGDQVLTWLATLLAEIASEVGYAVRYGGDEFMLLLPGVDGAEAQQVAYALLQQTRDQPFGLRQSGSTPPVTVSVGVASAPEDATSSTDLLRAADTALYHAKRAGKNQVSAAGEIDPEIVFEKTALHKLEVKSLSGRAKEFSIVSEALDRLAKNESTFLVADGAPGMGKTAFIDAIHEQLVGNDKFRLVHVSGVQQEAYRPYYLAAQIMTNMLQNGEDGGGEILEGLSDTERAHLNHVLPQLSAWAPDPAGESSEEMPQPSADEESLTREGIFTTIVQLIPRISGDRPLVLLIDDLQLADEASLLLMRILVNRDELPVFVCSASLESLEVGGTEEAPPLERFLAEYRMEEACVRIKLQPLSDDDITAHLRGMFPGLSLPSRFVHELVEITQGNPLFVGEIVRKLVTDQMLSFTGQEWTILPLDQGYLPRSLEEIVLQKISDLDSESRRLLQQASALGEDVPVSVLTGATDLEESKVLEFLDRAEALGLVKLGFQVNDEIMRFLGKRVLEISYGTIDEEQRQKLHGRVGAYQEGLYEQRLLPSASLLAYHFKRSSDQEKARRYEQMQIAYRQTVFDAEEAAGYTGDPIEPEPETGEALDAESLLLLPGVLRSLLTGVRSIQLYPPESNAIVKARREAHETVTALLEIVGRLNLSLNQRTLCVNGQVVDATEFGTLGSSFVELLLRADLRSLVFVEGLSDIELRHLVECLAHFRPEEIVPGFWKTFAIKHELPNVELRQVRYAAVRDGARNAEGRPAGPRAREEVLSEEDLTEIPSILRAFLAAATSVRLYPIGSEPVTAAVEEAYSSVLGILGRRASFSLAGMDDFLLANGSRISSPEQETLTTSFLELLRSVGLTSITISSGISKSDLEVFLAALRELPSSGTEPQFWTDFSSRTNLSNLSFNERQYAVLVGGSASGPPGPWSSDGGVDSPHEEYVPEVEVGDLGSIATQYRAPGGSAEDVYLTSNEGLGSGEVEEVSAAPDDPPAKDGLELTSDAISRFGKALLVKGDDEVFGQLLRRLFDDYPRQEPRARRGLLSSCSEVLDSLILALQHKFAGLAHDSLSAALSEETDAGLLAELARILHRMAETSVQLSDYEEASRIYAMLSSRKDELACSEDPGLSEAAVALDREVCQSVRDLLFEDLRSGETERLERSARVIGSLGSPSIPLLIEAIKQEKDLRVRQLSAGLLAILGPEAVKQIKRALVLEVIVEQRFHILEVIDTVTRDLRDELTYCLGDVNPKIRRAAFRLAERLNEDDLIEILVPFVRDEDPNAAKGTIRSLANLRSPTAVRALASILESTKEPEIAVACCQALGQIGDPGGIDALEKVLSQKSFLVMGPRWDGQVRATAVLALRQIEHPRASGLLRQLAADRDPVIRQLAETSVPA
jgi:diguanylate cyclase (GGDEF)-like protein